MTEQARASAAASEARAALEEELRLEDDDAPFPWLGGFNAQLYWCLARFGLSDAGVKRRARSGFGPKRDLWVNEVSGRRCQGCACCCCARGGQQRRALEMDIAACMCGDASALFITLPQDGTVDFVDADAVGAE